MTAAPAPSLAGFITFIRDVMQISTANLPDNATVIPFALAVAMTIVNPALNCVGFDGTALGIPSVNIFTLAVYNLAGDNLINYAPDPGTGSTPTYFSDLRKDFNCNAFVSGVIQSASDETTSESMVIMEAAKNFTLQNLQQLKTPWGRQYLAYAQAYGEIIGLS